MATLPSCFDDAPLIAADVARGVARLLWRQDLVALCEVPLGNGRRADLMAIDAKGCITIVEIKVSRADLRGDGKWPDYLDYCDRFCWAVPSGFALAPFEEAHFRPDISGLIVADRYDAEMVREPAIRRWRARDARPRRCALPAAPRCGYWAGSIPDWPGWINEPASARRLGLRSPSAWAWHHRVV